MSRDFGLWLKQSREKKNMSRMSLAKKVNVHYNSILRWETGTQFPTLDMAERLIEVLGCRLILEENDGTDALV